MVINLFVCKKAATSCSIFLLHLLRNVYIARGHACVCIYKKWAHVLKVYRTSAQKPIISEF